MSRVKGSPKTGGRQKGTPNKVTKSMKQIVLSVFRDIGDEAAMAEWAKNPKNASVFYGGLCGRLIPQQHEGSDDPQSEPIRTVLEIVTQPKP